MFNLATLFMHCGSRQDLFLRGMRARAIHDDVEMNAGVPFAACVRVSAEGSGEPAFKGHAAMYAKRLHLEKRFVVVDKPVGIVAAVRNNERVAPHIVKFKSASSDDFSFHDSFFSHLHDPFLPHLQQR